MTIEKILIVDDDALIRAFLLEALTRNKLEIAAVESGKKALKAIKENDFDLVVTDMKMPDMTGLELLKQIKEISPQTIVIVITAYGSIENAVEAMKLGAFHYLLKPFSPDAIEALIDKAIEHRALVEENKYLRQAAKNTAYLNEPFIAESPAMKKITADIAKIAKSQANIFILGESGTGKEVIAQAIHDQSLRKDRPFIKVNCAAVPDTLIESEFFGHEKGAFTGANAKRLGRFELANTGTLLLDEVTEIPLGLQAKLLRVIQEQEFERVGGTKPVKVDVRLISTSNRDLKIAIQDKVLREDLFYRLNVVPIYLPPLRERKEDIIPLARFFIRRLGQNKELSEEAKQKLLSYPWPGNVRELGNVIERAIVLDQGKIIAPEHLALEGLSLAL